jgi:hypothetical protein
VVDTLTRKAFLPELRNTQDEPRPPVAEWLSNYD